MNDLLWSHKCSHDDEPIRRGDSVLAPVFTIVDDAHHSSEDEEEQPQANLMSFVVVFAPGEGSGGKELTGGVTMLWFFQVLALLSTCALVYDHQGEELLALESPISIDVGAFVPRLPGFRLILSQLCGRGWETGALTLGKRMARLVQAITESDLETAYAATRRQLKHAAVKRHHRLGASAAGDGFVQYLLENGADPDFPSPDEIFHWSGVPTWPFSAHQMDDLVTLFKPMARPVETLNSKHLCNARDPEHLELLLKLPHMDPNRTSPEGWLPLIAALNRIELANDPMLPTYDGFCPFARAAFLNEDEEILRIMAKAASNINVKPGGYTVLRSACSARKAGVCRVLLECGMDVDDGLPDLRSALRDLFHSSNTPMPDCLAKFVVVVYILNLEYELKQEVVEYKLKQEVVIFERT
ncbi:hypothetical protein SELMODRAFT_418698 [Selaginella moellendorffii]|uniref:Uncharacterized protein n=1 Tax=Selaginella moellendorffii TaxID=88036 RepID=D8S6V6_SELML|nr:hypothetical protein SELMODRAFT_418698 [Selaginella moellendorffii]